ncbi:MAG: squalene--hopene cyclase [Phycisphaerae bacterium]|nr:squalene--hopene cyclase [Phycisphaerae bacterium]
MSTDVASPIHGTRPARPDELAAASESLSRAIEALKSLQKPDGHFCAELEGDSILQSEYILMKFILHQEDEPMIDGRPGEEVLARIGDYLRSQQREDGGWGQYPGSGIDVSATVKAYFALKLLGDDPESPSMQKARRRIHELGGAEKCNSFSNFYLACLGQISWNACPAIPPEIVHLPRWFYFHMDKVSAWTRTMILPLAIVATMKPSRKLPAHRRIDELFLDNHQRNVLSMKPETPLFWRMFFKGVDGTLKIVGSIIGTAPRRRSMDRAMRWMLDRAGQDGPAATDGLGAIFPPMVYIQVAFQVMGYRRDDPLVQRAERELDAFFIEEDGRIRIQPCFSPVWDSGISLYAFTDAGLDHSDESVSRVCDWLRSKECGFVGDWVRNLGGNATGAGWYFEYNNSWYPDVDDTVMVAMALRRAGGAENIEAADRGVKWVLSMQNDDGGWAAFDKTEHRQVLEYVPFADHNAMQDPSCPDITGRVLECLSWHGMGVSDPTIARAITYIRSHQRPEGCWFGRWGVNYIYGTWQAVIGPIRCGVDRSEPWIQKAGAWMKSIQKEDGSFGESADSYEDESLMGRGNSTASQTAWAAMVLQEIYGPDDPDLARAIAWLSSTQLSPEAAADPQRNPDGDPAGSWCELEFTGTGFPRVFYLRYHLYRLYFPLMALGRWVRSRSAGTG